MRPTFEDDGTWYCGTAIAVPYGKLYKDFAATDYYANMVCLPPIPEGKYPVFSHTKKERIDEHSLFTS